MNPLRKLETYGQSIWLDFIRREMLRSGELERLIKEDGLQGITSNPSIFEKAIAGSHDYDDAIRALALEDRGMKDIYQSLVVEDLQRAADLFRPTYEQSKGRDGFVSLEVSPHLAYDTGGTLAEARLLWAALNRPNVLIKVPATLPGVAAIQQLITEGISVNVTLLFSLSHYQEVIEAYLAGLETRAAQNQSLEGVVSVASFFLSRIDVAVDALLEKAMQHGDTKAQAAAALRGQVAIASARAAHQLYKESFEGQRFLSLAAQGARPQRLLWASTSTKNPAYSDVKYVEALIGPDTVNTLSLETLNAYRDHGNPAQRLEKDTTEASAVLGQLPLVSIDLQAITQRLEEEAVQKFIEPLDRLLQTLAQKREAALKEAVDRQTFQLGRYQSDLERRIRSLEQEQFALRLWRKDASLWKAPWSPLGWLHLAERMEGNLGSLLEFVNEVKEVGFRHVVHVGMGGASLAARVFQRTFLPSQNGLPLTVLDTTDPATILKVEREIPVEHTLFLVASKSGTTAETVALSEYFYMRVKNLKGSRAGENFVAITDPWTALTRLAEALSFRKTFLNFGDVGGRYSALSYFGLVPAALMGVDVAELLIRALRMAHSSASCLPVQRISGIVLGAALAELAHSGRDKVTFLAPEPIAALGMWLEQLLAESTGKQGIGLLPVIGESLGEPSVYGQDRLFVTLGLKSQRDEALERGAAALLASGQPVISIEMDDLFDLGQEFFRWEVATATAGAILGINPFDQPDVQASKDNTDRLMRRAKEGQLTEETPILAEGPLRLYAQTAMPTITETLTQFFSEAQPGEYVTLMAYLMEDPAVDQLLQELRCGLRDRLHLATTLGYGPRFLHSTGQYHKGGPNKGLFLQLTAGEAEDVPIPGVPQTFGVLKRAEALGDLEALRLQSRRVLRIHLDENVRQGLEALKHVVEGALNNVGVAACEVRRSA